MELRVVQTSPKLILEWDAVPGAVAGYRGRAEGVEKWSQTQSTRMTFAANATGIVIQALGVEDEGHYPVIEPPPPPPVSSFDIPRWLVKLPASPGIGDNGRVAHWRQYKTGGEALLNAGSGKTVPHLITPAPNSRYVSGPRSWEWWILGSILIPASYPVTGRNFATINPHNSSYDVGPSGIGGVGWGFGSGVSALHIFFANGQEAPLLDNDFSFNINPSPSTKWNVVLDVERDKRYDIAMRVIFGRLDKELGLAGPGVAGGGIGDHPNGGAGRAWVYVNGELKADTGNRNTLQRATAPDGKTYTQTCLHRCWDGAYCVPGLPAAISMERTASRIGRTLAEALADGKNGFTKHAEWMEPTTGPSATDLAPLRSVDFVVPQV